MGAAVVVGGVQAGYGLYQSITGNRRLKRLLNQRETYKAPDEVNDIYNLALNQAQTGYGASTMKYLTNQNDRALSTSVNAATRLGANPNDINRLYDTSFENIFKISADNEMMQFKKLDSVYAGMKGIIEAKDAEYASEQNLLKDKMAMEAQKVEAGMKNIQSGLNLGMSALSAAKANKLFEERTNVLKGIGAENPIAKNETLPKFVKYGDANVRLPKGYLTEYDNGSSYNYFGMPNELDYKNGN